MTRGHHYHTSLNAAVGYLVHCIAFLITGTGIWYSINYINPNGEGVFYYRGWPGKLKYLTFWSQMLQPTYFLICVLNDILGGNTTDKHHFVHRSFLQRFRDNLHATIIFPLGIFVVSTFWCIYAVDRELVYPKELDKHIPVWHNQITHTSPLVFLLLEKMFVNITYPSKKWGMAGTLLVGLTYQIWILWIAYTQDLWTYPILKVLSIPLRCVFLVTLWAVLVLIYLCGEWLSKELWWGPTAHMKKLK